jgi:hypothetical protein
MEGSGPFDVLRSIAERLSNELLLYSLAVCVIAALATYAFRHRGTASLIAPLFVIVIAFGGPIVLRHYFVQEEDASSAETYLNVTQTAHVEFEMDPASEKTLQLNCPAGSDPIGIDFKTFFPARFSLEKNGHAAVVNIYNLHGVQRPARSGWIAALCAEGGPRSQ